MGLKGEVCCWPSVSKGDIRSSHTPSTKNLSVALQAMLNFLGSEKQLAAFCCNAMSHAPETRRKNRTYTSLFIFPSTRGFLNLLIRFWMAEKQVTYNTCRVSNKQRTLKVELRLDVAFHYIELQRKSTWLWVHAQMLDNILFFTLWLSWGTKQGKFIGYLEVNITCKARELKL